MELEELWDGAGAKLGLKPGLERQRTGSRMPVR